MLYTNLLVNVKASLLSTFILSKMNFEGQDRMRLFYSKILPILVFLGIPAVDTILSYKINQQAIYEVFGYQLLPIDLIFIFLFFYSIYPIRYSSQQYFKSE